MTKTFPQRSLPLRQEAGNDNVLPFGNGRKQGRKRPHPPMVNLPQGTKILILLLVAVHGILTLGTLVIHPALEPLALSYGGFVPANWTGTRPFAWWTPLTLVSFGFLHGGWFHLGINVLMLMAFGSGVERLLGARNFVKIYAGATVAAALTHLAFSPFSGEIVVGASGGISGLFGAMLVLMKRQGRLGGGGLTPAILVWIGLTVAFGMMGAPDGSPVAWLAHIGGFLGGLGLALNLTNRKG